MYRPSRVSRKRQYPCLTDSQAKHQIRESILSGLREFLPENALSLVFQFLHLLVILSAAKHLVYCPGQIPRRIYLSKTFTFGL